MINQVLGFIGGTHSTHLQYVSVTSKMFEHQSINSLPKWQGFSRYPKANNICSLFSVFFIWEIYFCPLHGRSSCQNPWCFFQSQKPPKYQTLSATFFASVFHSHIGSKLGLNIQTIILKWVWTCWHRPCKVVTPHPQNTYTAMCPDFFKAYFLIFCYLNSYSYSSTTWFNLFGIQIWLISVYNIIF